MGEFFTWAFLGSFAGAVVGTALLTQFFKSIFAKLPTQVLSYIIAIVIMALATAATGGFTQSWTVWAMIPFNAVLISLSSNGAYDGIVRAFKGKEK